VNQRGEGAVAAVGVLFLLWAAVDKLMKSSRWRKVNDGAMARFIVAIYVIPGGRGRRVRARRAVANRRRASVYANPGLESLRGGYRASGNPTRTRRRGALSVPGVQRFADVTPRGPEFPQISPARVPTVSGGRSLAHRRADGLELSVRPDACARLGPAPDVDASPGATIVMDCSNRWQYRDDVSPEGHWVGHHEPEPSLLHGRALVAVGS